MEKKTNGLSRRDFLRTTGLATAGLMLGGLSPLSAFGAADPKKKPTAAATDRVRLACIGIGNRGWDLVKEFGSSGLADIVALCDVDLDAEFCQKALAAHPGAKRYRDFRKMFDEMALQIDAVAVAIPDHSHFPATMLALSLGKHVYVEKPMARTFYEAQLMMDMAARNPQLATQVGNQGHSEANYFQFKAWMDAGIIKDVTEVTAHMNSARRWHGWDQNIRKFPDSQPLPPGMDWNTWLGTAGWHDFNHKFHPGDWRSWYDFGMGRWATGEPTFSTQCMNSSSWGCHMKWSRSNLWGTTTFSSRSPLP